MNTTLFSAAALATLMTIGGAFVASDDVLAGSKKADRLPVANATASTCNDSILGSIVDECVQHTVDTTTVNAVRSVTVEWRDETTNTSTLVRVPAVDIAEINDAQDKVE